MIEHTPATLYKILNADGTAYHGGQGRWHLPAGDRPGRWMPRIPNPVPCERGYHLCRAEHLRQWIGPALFVAEASGAVVEADTKIVVERARLLACVETYTERTLRLFACDCAERALDRTDVQDSRSRHAIATARAYATGEASAAQLGAARDAAWDAARGAARGVARDAAWDAATDAAWDAARDAAWGAARDAAWDAAKGAARGAARNAARGAAWDAERVWQTDRLLRYLRGEVT